MLIALHRDTKHDLSPTNWARILEAQGVEIRWVDLTARDAFGQVMGCDGVMWRHGGKPADRVKANRILFSIERYLGISVYPDIQMSWHDDDKLAVHYMLKAADVPTPPTWVFWNKEQAIEWANHASYPQVFKLSTGDMGDNVVKVDTYKEAHRLIEGMFGNGIYAGSLNKKQESGILGMQRFFTMVKEEIGRAFTGKSVRSSRGKDAILEKGYAYFEEFIPHEFETRITVAGDQIWAYRQRPRPGDFRVSGMTRDEYHDPSRIDLRADYNPNLIDPRCVRMAIDICDRLGFYALMIDFLIHNGDPVVIDLWFTIDPHRDDRPYPGVWTRNMEWRDEAGSRSEAGLKAFLERLREPASLVPALASSNGTVR